MRFPPRLVQLGFGITALLMAAILPAPTPAAAKKDPRAAESKTQAAGPGRMTAETFEGLKLRSIGPAFMSGRVADIALDPRDPSTWYVAVGSGNLWKTTNAGTTWTPLFEDQSSYSLGALALDPKRSGVVWLGTGENVGGRHVGFGDGVYLSRDGGKTWTKSGLERSEHIAKILVDPRDSNVVFVAAQGPLWSGGGDRGLFKTTDGGESWRNVLSAGKYTGVTDVVLDPRDPGVMVAATHQRLRTVAALVNGGPESGIWKSTDGGESWREVTEGLPEEEMGKIGLAISPQRPDVLYATIELAHRKGGFWKSTDGGESWSKQSDHIAGGTGPHYYQEIYASPHAFDRIYQMNVRLHVSEDGGKSWRDMEGEFKHVDNHAMAFHPTDPDWLLVGCDGGLYESRDLGETWKFTANLPVTQFYKVAVDYDEPFYNVYGGTQDNNTQGGPSRTDAVNGIRNADWLVTLFGDGHQPAVDPTNPDIVYSEWQQGNLVRFDRKTGEMVYIQPQPGADEPWDRFNWDAPILLSPHDPKRIYFASQRVWQSDDRGDSWRPISGDLSRGLDRLRLPVMGRVQSWDAVWDVSAMSKFGTITSLAESPLVPGLIYAGTDDGLMHVTENGGASWRHIARLTGVAERFFVNDIKADLHQADTVYVAVDNHKAGDFAPYLLKSTDRGRSWKSITGDLPERHLVWRIVQDHVRPGLLFVGTELGVFFTIDGGTRWIELTGGVPTIPFRDLAIQTRENDLVGATFGRGFYILDDYTPLREVTAELLEREAALFPVRAAHSYVERRPLGDDGKASQGDAYFVADNPPFGAVFTYYLRDELTTREKRRQEEEKEAIEAKRDTPSPGWDELRDEELEEEPAILLVVRDAQGRTVRRLAGPTGKGFHRVAWDLRHPSPAPWEPPKEEEEEDEEEASGFLAPHGRYTVGLAKRVAGELTELGLDEAFEVTALRTPTLSGASASEIAEFTRELQATQRDVGATRKTLEETATRLEAIRETLLRSTVGDSRLGDETRALERRVAEAKLALSGSEARAAMNDPGPVSVERRLSVAAMGNRFSTYGPTPTHRASLAVARSRLAELQRELRRIVGDDLPALERRLDLAGVPWTPGRGPGSGS